MLQTMVSDLEGKKVFVTRFIRSQKPPDGLISDTNLPIQQVMVRVLFKVLTHKRFILQKKFMALNKNCLSE